MSEKILDSNSLLPELRQELQLLPGPRAPTGEPSWTLHDPVSQRFYYIGEREFILLTYWQRLRVADVLIYCNKNSKKFFELEDVEKLLLFLFKNELLKVVDKKANQILIDRHLTANRGWKSWLLRNYLFFRVPLIRPDRFLTATYPYIRRLFTTKVLMFFLILTLLGILLVLRQLDYFFHSFSHLYSLSGALTFFITLSCIKVAHEFGHAYACKHFGLKVPSMGVAFMVLWPVLYTDATEAWKLGKRNQRIKIGIAGVATELAIAGVATFLWSFLPEGGLKSVMFIVATTTWVFSLLINLNPFMRFDGYYVLVDVLDTPNLQPRSFALAQWWLREWLFGINAEPPEIFPRVRHYTLIVYAFLTWIYRFFLFLGIALLLYHIAFKLLGIILFIVEVAVLLIKPIVNEMKVWWKLREQLPRRRKVILPLLVSLGLFVACFPWFSSVELPGIYTSTVFQRIYPPVDAQIRQVAIKHGQQVKVGDELFNLSTPGLFYEIKRVKARHNMLQLLLKRSGSTPEMLDATPVIAQQLAEAESKLQGLIEKQNKLSIQATIAGEILQLKDGLMEGTWINSKQQMALVVDPQSGMIEAYVPEKDLNKVVTGASARFYPDIPELEPIDCEIASVSMMHSHSLDNPYLASIHGGDIPVRVESNGALINEEALFLITLKPKQQLQTKLAHIIKGQVSVDVNSYSMMESFINHVLQVFIRETSF
ncbi:HlyD family efflux transporter periplasmic adaptor subunit [Zooshikella marina]|uniref:HlyD family efflux transporter periplasmic adaptor subunit n=1 Tax=Zooshikella ganghwensis TaxID=202772 RepID=UPI001BAFF438|nr:HlyD family efflux transporter periplasmic adaptor subunit [Zooshikella ganghwensis]MBU2707111.1 HlyD family efflux transporter periplasmic adaptor subunit [Zooshikella ganghwensis]